MTDQEPLACWEKQLLTGDVFLCALPTGHNGDCQRPNPPAAAIALGDQWHAEMMDLARALLAKVAGDNAVVFTQDDRDLLEAGASIGIGAALWILAERDMLKPETTP
jgi:hypothetical protein